MIEKIAEEMIKDASPYMSVKLGRALIDYQDKRTIGKLEILNNWIDASIDELEQKEGLK